MREQKTAYVKTRNNDLEAYVFLPKPEGGASYSKEDVKTLLERNGIREGIDDSNITAMVKKGIYDREVKVAVGKPPVHGRDGYFEYFFDPNQKRKEPEIREDGSVDYTSINIIKCVLNGDKLAVYHPSVKGKEGHDVRGRVLPPRPAKELKPLVGTGIIYSENTLTYSAALDGKVELGRGRLSVYGMHEIRGDVDTVFGDIDFKGDIIIYGNVKPGVTIKATKTITITGVVESACLFATEDIIVKGGILGGERTEVVTDGDLFADFIEYANVQAKGDVRANIMMNCEIVAGGTVTASGRTGAIIGGTVYGIAGVKSKEIGNDAFLKTVVAAGIKEMIQQDGLALERKVKVIGEQMAEISHEIDEIEREIRMGIVDEEKIMKKQHLMRVKIQKDCALKETKLEIEEMSHRLEGGNTAKVTVDGNIYMGSVVQIDEQQIYIDKNKNYVEFLKDSEDNMIIKNIY